MEQRESHSLKGEVSVADTISSLSDGRLSTSCPGLAQGSRRSWPPNSPAARQARDRVLHRRPSGGLAPVRGSNPADSGSQGFFRQNNPWTQTPSDTRPTKRERRQGPGRRRHQVARHCSECPLNLPLECHELPLRRSECDTSHLTSHTSESDERLPHNT